MPEFHLNLSTEYFHHICIYVLYGAMVLLAFVIVERRVYYALLALRARGLSRAFEKGDGDALATLTARKDTISRNLGSYLKLAQDPAVDRNQLEDASSAGFITAHGHIEARLWILDTIVTAAPLIGLLGTILGIMDTFNALSAGGVSDPAAVSRGIAAALIATAIGIGTALFGLLGHNYLHQKANQLTEKFKWLLLSCSNLARRQEADDTGHRHKAPSTSKELQAA